MFSPVLCMADGSIGLTDEYYGCKVAFIGVTHVSKCVSQKGTSQAIFYKIVECLPSGNLLSLWSVQLIFSIRLQSAQTKCAELKILLHFACFVKVPMIKLVWNVILISSFSSSMGWKCHGNEKLTSGLTFKALVISISRFMLFCPRGSTAS